MPMLLHVRSSRAVYRGSHGWWAVPEILLAVVHKSTDIRETKKCSHEHDKGKEEVTEQGKDLRMCTAVQELLQSHKSFLASLHNPSTCLSLPSAFNPLNRSAVRFTPSLMMLRPPPSFSSPLSPSLPAPGCSHDHYPASAY